MLRDIEISEGGGRKLRSRAAIMLRWAHASDPLLWAGLILAHVIPVVVGSMIARDTGFGDVRLYWHWVNEGLNGQGWPVIDLPSVYPVGALLPMIVLAPLTSAGGSP